MHIKMCSCVFCHPFLFIASSHSRWTQLDTAPLLYLIVLIQSVKPILFVFLHKSSYLQKVRCHSSDWVKLILIVRHIFYTHCRWGWFWFCPSHVTQRVRKFPPEMLNRWVNIAKQWKQDWISAAIYEQRIRIQFQSEYINSLLWFDSTVH